MKRTAYHIVACKLDAVMLSCVFERNRGFDFSKIVIVFPPLVFLQQIFVVAILYGGNRVRLKNQAHMQEN